MPNPDRSQSPLKLGRIRRALHRQLPANLEDPIGLLKRLLKTGDSAARFAMLTAGLGLLATPADLLLSPLERRRHCVAPPRQLPLIFVCGAPRSGTTLVYQTLVEHLPVGYYSNLTAIFPRSPLTVTSWFKRFLKSQSGNYHNYYGKTDRLAGPNDSLYLWDRWLGPDRSVIPEEILPDRQVAMRRFFAASTELFAAPLVNKNNSLNLSAHLLAPWLENTYFICLNRSRYQLAQSLYKARSDIHGTVEVSYGAQPDNTESQNAVKSVCNQVLHHEAINRQQQERLGKHRFWNIQYEDFCSNPRILVERIARDILGNPSSVRGKIPANFAVSQTQRVPDDIAASIKHHFASCENI